DIIKNLFGSTKEHFYLEPSIKMDYGFNIHIGDHFYANFDCVFLDVAPIIFGDHVYIAPRCCFYTAGHPIAAEVRNTDLEYGYPIRVGSNVWFGGNVVVNPGVTIGSNVVIGSGSVVTKDIPSNVVACGNPCKVIREITEEDTKQWQQRKSYFDNEKF
ncbi:MAG: sugar O-acetyltransferase, partial [Anaeroplasmataceae bacterium]|nr:sugar O-acetyltransferase [Anaeroplasmataceae bacterium]